MKRGHFSVLQLLRFCNEFLILAVLNRGSRHGYELALEIEQSSGGYFTFNHGTLYPILHKLEKEGLIRGHWREEGPRRKRKIYTITGRGKKFYQNLSGEWRTFFTQLFALGGETGT
jgi:PadR family transcriptional regulator PadR